MVTLRLEAAGRLPAPAVQPPTGGVAEGAVTGHQTLLLRGGPVRAPVYDRGLLGAGAALAGPAIVTQLDATTLVPPGWDAVLHASGALMLRRG